MRSYLFFLFMLLSASSVLMAEQCYVTVGTGTSSTFNVPYCNYYKHGSVQIIYSSTELKGAGKINTIAFQVAAAKEYATTGVDIYMGHKSTSKFDSATDYVPLSDLTLVYSGTPTLGKEVGWEEFTLTTPFEYDGTNLVVAIGKHASSYDNALSYQYTTASNSVLYRQSDSDSNYGDLSKDIEYKTASSRPNVRFSMDLPLTTVNGIVYNCNNGIASLFGVTENLTAEVSIPSSVTYQGKKYAVTSIPSGIFTNNTSITSLTIPASVTVIADKAFSGCSNVATLIIEDSSNPLEVENSTTQYSQFHDFHLKKLYLGRNISYPVSTYSSYKYGSPFGGQSELSDLTIGSKVTELGKGMFHSDAALTTVTLPNSITTLGDYAFNECTQLSSITFSRNLTALPAYAFYKCTALQSLTIPATISTIGKYAFDGCSGITNLTIEDAETTLTIEGANSQNQFNTFKLESLYLGRNLSYQTSTSYYSNYGSPFARQSALSTVTIGPKVTEISPYMFYSTAISELIIPAALTKIGDRAFYYCTKIKTITIEDGTTPLHIDDRNVFYNLSSLESIYMGRNITYNYNEESKYGHDTPFYYVSIPALTIGPKVTEISAYLFYKQTDLKQLSLPASLTKIGESAFENCTNLCSVTNFSNLDITSGSTDHGYVAYYCLNVYNADSFAQEGDFLYYTKSGVNYIYDYVGEATEITVPAGYQFADAAFRDKTELVSVTLPNGVKRISAHLFHGCTKLSNVNIPEGVTEIDDFAFCYCQGLKEITLPSTLKRIGAGAFSRCQYLSSIEIPNGVTEIAQMAFKRCDRLTSITLPSTITTIEPYTFMGCYYLNTVVVPEGVTSIGNFAFYACLYFKHLTLPSTLKSIGRYAFYYNQLAELELPSGLTHLGEGAFKASQGFKSVTIPDGITEVADFAFCNTNVRDISLPDNLTRIGRFAFSGCPVQYINWPSHLTTIGFSAFGNSDELRIPAIPSTVTSVGDMLFFGSQTNEGDITAVYCYANAVVPTTTFHGTDMSKSALYVRPELLEAYKASAHAALFADIRPVGDYNGDGIITASDLTSIIHVNATLGDYGKKHLQLGARDVNGDGTITIEDIDEARRALLGQTTAAGDVTVMPSTSLPDPFIPTLSDDCTLMTFDGYFQTEDDASMELLNHIRWEACHEGVRDPDNSDRLLVPADYYVAEWSTDLENIARRRAVHTVISQYHSSMGRYNNHRWNNVSGGGECIGFYDMLFSIYAYYDEKDSWVNRGTRTTGHYTALIEKATHYYGLAYMKGYVSLLAPSSSLPEGADQSYLSDELLQPMVLDVYTKYIQDHVITTPSNSLYRYTAPTLELGKPEQLELRAHLLFSTAVSSKCNRYVKYYNREITFSSKNPEVATITPDGVVTTIKPGEVIIEAQLDGSVVATDTLTVTCNHRFDVSEPDADLKATGTCSLCGETIEGEVPTYFYLWWTNATLNPMSHSTGVPSNNPVGTQVECHMYQCDGEEAFRQICVEYLTPTLLSGPSEFHLSNDYVYFNVTGSGTGKMRMYLKYNPSYSRTYTFNLTEPDNSASAPSRAAQSEAADELVIPTFPLPDLLPPDQTEE